MDFSDEAIYNEMLQGLGIFDDLLPVPKKGDKPVDKQTEPSKTDWEPPVQILGFQHLTHIRMERGYSPYKKIGYFSHLLDQYLGRNYEQSICPQVLKILKRHKLNVHKKNAYFLARKYLKQAGHTSPAYRRIFWALKKLGGYGLRISPQLEELIKADFEGLAELFDQKNFEGRKNMISYNLVMQIIFARHGVTSFYHLPGIKDSKKYQSLLDMYRELR